MVKRPIYKKCIESKPIQTNVNQLTWWNHEAYTSHDEWEFLNSR